MSSSLLAFAFPRHLTAVLATFLALLVLGGEASAQNRQGAVPSHLTLVSPLGKGGQATVWRARNSRLGRDVAVRFSRDVRQTRAAMRALRTSRWFPRQIATDGESYEELELLEHHRPLGYLDRLDFQPRTVGVAVSIVCNVLRALEDLHATGHIHRDLHLGNVMIDPAIGAPSVRLIDLGLSAPEGTTHHADPLDDVFDAAHILVGLVTGRAPAMPAHVGQRGHDMPAITHAVAQITDPRLRGVLARALSRDRHARYLTARALREALEPFASSTEPTTPP